MRSRNLEVIQKYQQVLKQNPRSQYFSALSEALREEQRLDEAMKVARTGLIYHPKYSSGRISLARVYIDKKQWSKAEKELCLAKKHSPDKALTYKLLIRCYKELQNLPAIVNSYKMLLLLQPNNTKVQKIVQTLEPLLSENVTDQMPSVDKAPLTLNQAIESPDLMVSFAMAYMMRDELKSAQAILKKGLSKFPTNKALQKTWTQFKQIIQDEKKRRSRLQNSYLEDYESQLLVLKAWILNIKKYHEQHSK